MIVVRQENFNLKLFSELYSDLCDAIDLINSTFTFHLVFVMTSILIIDVFAVYSTLREFRADVTEYRLAFIIIANPVWILIQYSVKALMAHAASSTTNEAEKSFGLVTKLITTLSLNRDMKTDLNYLLIQMQRKKNLENIFFVINWNLLLAVSIST